MNDLNNREMLDLDNLRHLFETEPRYYEELNCFDCFAEPNESFEDKKRYEEIGWENIYINEDEIEIMCKKYWDMYARGLKLIETNPQEKFNVHPAVLGSNMVAQEFGYSKFQLFELQKNIELVEDVLMGKDLIKIPYMMNIMKEMFDAYKVETKIEFYT